MRKILPNALLFLFLLVSIFSFSQDSKDPLGKPKLWSTLQKNASNQAVWSAYVGKPWVSLTLQEKEQINQWKELLKGNYETFGKVRLSEEWNVEEQQKLMEEEQKMELIQKQESYFTQLSQTFTQLPEHIADLRQNTAANFVIIEEAYKDEFEALGLSYTTYRSAHPKGEYSKEQWLKDVESKLLEKKQAQFKSVKEEIAAAWK